MTVPQRVEVADREVRIIGSNTSLLQVLTAAAGVKPATPGVRSSVLKWRRRRDSNPRYGFRPYNGLANRRLQPLGHVSVTPICTRLAGQASACSLKLRQTGTISRGLPDGAVVIGRATAGPPCESGCIEPACAPESPARPWACVAR
jgi:hypothetical protein